MLFLKMYRMFRHINFGTSIFSCTLISTWGFDPGQLMALTKVPARQGSLRQGWWVM
jgi:hypothetical protein